MCLFSILVSWGYMPRNGIAGSVKWKWKLLSHVRLFAMAWVIQSMEFSSPDYWSGLPSLLQGIFTTQGSNPGLPHCRWILYQLSHKGSPRILEWVAYSFSSGSSCPRSWTGVSCIASRFFTNWAFREAPPCFLHDPTNVGYLISGSSASSKPSLYIWKFSVHENFQRC